MRPPRTAAWPKDCVAVVSISAQHHNDDRVRRAKDEYGAPDQAQLIAGPDGAVEIMSGVAHFPYREAGPAVLDRIARFLAPLS